MPDGLTVIATPALRGLLRLPRLSPAAWRRAAHALHGRMQEPQLRAGRRAEAAGRHVRCDIRCKGAAQPSKIFATDRPEQAMKQIRHSITIAKQSAARHTVGAAAAASAVLLGLGASLAFAGDYGQMEYLPPEKTEQGVDYREGGIGEDEAQAMRQKSSEYPLMLTFAEYLDGQHAYTADVQVRIADASGDPVLQTQSDGPLMLVDLPRGEYEITATYEGKTKEQRVQVQPQESKNIVFEWGGPT
ncbi:MAG: hypothetical protein AB1651_08980 [Pseudomonadota bacterium]